MGTFGNSPILYLPITIGTKAIQDVTSTSTGNFTEQFFDNIPIDNNVISQQPLAPQQPSAPQLPDQNHSSSIASAPPYPDDGKTEEKKL